MAANIKLKDNTTQTPRKEHETNLCVGSRSKLFQTVFGLTNFQKLPFNDRRLAPILVIEGSQRITAAQYSLEKAIKQNSLDFHNEPPGCFVVLSFCVFIFLLDLT